MNKLISEFLKKLTISTMVLILFFILLAPTADALWYDWRKAPKNIQSNPIGDTDPWDEQSVIKPPPDDNDQFLIFRIDFKIGFNRYLYYKLGWNFDNLRKDDKPIRDIHIITPDDSETDNRPTTNNR